MKSAHAALAFIIGGIFGCLLMSGMEHAVLDDCRTEVKTISKILIQGIK